MTSFWGRRRTGVLCWLRRHSLSLTSDRMHVVWLTTVALFDYWPRVHCLTSDPGRVVWLLTPGALFNLWPRARCLSSDPGRVLFDLWPQARVDEELLLFEAFAFASHAVGAARLQLRFKKLSHGLLLRERRSGRAGGKRAATADPAPLSVRKWLRQFDDICGYSGVSGGVRVTCFSPVTLFL